ncbi:MAG: galactosylceramidase, partial [Gemmatimonadaceae bacterium]
MDRPVSAISATTIHALEHDVSMKSSRINIICACALLLAGLGACTATAPQAGPPPAIVTATHAAVVVDGSTRGRTFDGIGGVSSGGSSRLLFDYPEPARSDILDYMFKPGYGASLQLLKVEIGGEMNGTVGAEASHSRQPEDLNCNRGYEWWLMKEAKARNPDIKLIGLEWGAPGWFRGGFWSDDNITYIINWVDCAEKQGLKIDYIGGWNESGFDPAWYVSFANRLKTKYPNIKIIAADNAHTAEWNVTTAMANHAAFNAATDIVGVHGPGGSRVDPEYSSVHPSETGLKLGKPLWASELSSLAHDVGAIPLARVFNRSYIDARITGQMIWTPLSAWYPTLPIADTGPIVAEWPFSGYYDIGKSVWTLAHTTQFTAPGWHYLDNGSKRLPSGATMVTLAAPQNSDYTVVVEAMDVRAPTTITVNLENLPPRSLQIWETDLGSEENADRFRKISTITPEKRAFTLRLEPQHLVHHV